MPIPMPMPMPRCRCPDFQMTVSLTVYQLKYNKKYKFSAALTVEISEKVSVIFTTVTLLYFYNAEKPKIHLL